MKSQTQNTKKILNKEKQNEKVFQCDKNLSKLKNIKYTSFDIFLFVNI